MMDVFKKWTRCSILLFVLFAMQSCGPARERSVSRGSYTFPNEGGSITVKGVSSGDVRVELIARNLELFEVLQILFLLTDDIMGQPVSKTSYSGLGQDPVSLEIRNMPLGEFEGWLKRVHGIRIRYEQKDGETVRIVDVNPKVPASVSVDAFKPQPVKLQDGVNYYAFSSDREAPDATPGVRQYIYEAVYLSESYRDRNTSLKSGKVFRLTPIGKRRNPAWTSQGERLAYMDGSGGNDGVNIVVYEVSSQEFSVKNNSHPMAANTLSWNRAGDRLAYLSNDQMIVVYDFDLGEEIKLLDVSNPSSSFYIGAENISMSPCGEWIAFSDRDWGSPNEVSNWNVHLLSVGNKEVRNLTESIDTFGITSEIHWEQDGSAFHFNTALLENGRRIGNRRMVYRLDEERLETYEGSIRGKIDQRFRYWRP